MRKVIRRLKNGVHNDVPSTYSEAEMICGHRLDRRRNYAIINNEVCGSVNWTQPCSGCHEGVEGDRGMGCDECGYTGKSIQSFWLPIDVPQPEGE